MTTDIQKIQITNPDGSVSLVDTIPATVKIHKDSIIVGERMRRDLGDIQELAESIRDTGLVHPPAIDEKRNLVGGGRRFAAMTQVLKWDWIPVTMTSTGGSELKLRMMELEENVRRKEMTWKERCVSIAKVHSLHRSDAALEGDSWTRKHTGSLLGISEGTVNYCVEMSNELKKPDSVVHKAESLGEAFQLLLKQKQAEATGRISSFAKALVSAGSKPRVAGERTTLSIDSLITGLSKTKEVTDTVEVLSLAGQETSVEGVVSEILSPDKDAIEIDLSKYLLKGSCLDHMSTMPAESIDHIVTDIPYGIDMDNLQQSSGVMDMSSVAAEHTVSGNLELMRDMMPLFFKVLKPNAFCVLWYDLEHHQYLIELAQKAGFKVCRWPLVWVKTHRCKNEAAQYNFTKATEFALVLRKGIITLVQPQGVNFNMNSGDEARERFKHPFAKPVELWKWIFNACCIKGQTIYDPFAGRGSGTIAAAESGYTPLASELNDQHFHFLTENMKQTLLTWFKGKTVNFK